MIQTRHSAVLATLALLLLPLLLLELLLYFLLFLALLLAFLLLHRKTTGTAAVTGTATCADAKARSTASILRELRRGRFRRSAAAVVQEVMSADLPEDLLVAEELVAEVCQTLEVCDFSSKVLRDLQRSLGESCLYLSGGGMLGMYHLGTVRRLLEEDLMPQHLCGTSVGSIVGAYVATRTDDELRRELTDLDGLQEWYRQMGPLEGPFPVQYWEVVVRVLWRGYIYDYMNQYKNQATFVSNALTFAEAYQRTGRSFTITCTPVSGGPVVLLNRHTAPNVMIASAICASSSMPMLVEAVRLLEKAPDGSSRPWSGSSELMRDGNMLADSPCEQMQRWNLRWSIVSQVNPHVVPFSMPFVLAKRISQFSGVFASRLTSAEGWLRRCIWSTLRSFQGWITLPREGSWISQLLFQDYFGNVNIIHYEMRFRDYLRLIKNETSLEDFRNKVHAAACCSDRELPRQRLRKKMEAALEAALLRRSFCEDGSDRVGSRSLRSRRIAGRRERRV